MSKASKLFGASSWLDTGADSMSESMSGSMSDRMSISGAMDMFNPERNDLPSVPPGGFDPASASGPGKSTLINQYYSGGRYQFSGDRDTDAVLIGSKWTITNLTYSFPSSGAFYGSNYKDGENLYFTPFNSQQRNGIRYAMSLIQQYTPLTLTEVTESNSVHANFRFGQSAQSDAVPSAYANFPADSYYAGDVWFGQTGQPFYTTPAKGNWGLATEMHELGHAFGLKHGHDDYTNENLADILGYSGTRRGSVALTPSRDGQDWSLMTYRTNPGVPLEFGGEGYNQPQTYMQEDIAALQYLYGANFNTQSGNTTYQWSDTTGEMFINGVGQGAPTSNKISMTVWDGGGIDTYDLSNYGTDLYIDLAPGSFSIFDQSQLVNHRAATGNYALSVGNVANARQYNGDPRSLIENAIGSYGGDIIYGNAANNTFKGFEGNDYINGRTGINTSVYLGAYADYTITSQGGAVIVHDNVGSRDGEDTLVNIRFLSFSDRLVDLAGPLPSDAAVRNDTNGDGKGDLIFQNSNGTVAVWTMNGATISAAAGVSGAYAPPGWQVRGTGDLNGDGNADMLLQNTNSGAVALWAMSGSTALATAVLSITPGPQWVLLGSGDLNGDGKGDLVFQNTSTNVVAGWLMDGGTIISAAGVSGAYAPPGWAVKAIGDLNADGKADLLLQNSSSGAVALWAMSGTTALATAVLPITPGAAWRLVGTGDLNGDGKSDLVFQNNSTNVVAGWLMDGATVLSAGQVSGAYVPPGWNLQGAEDLNGDGKADLVFHNTGGALAAWIMDGLTAASATVLSLNPGPSWRVVGGEPGDTTNAMGPDSDGQAFASPDAATMASSMAPRLAREMANETSRATIPAEPPVSAAMSMANAASPDWLYPQVCCGADA